MTDPAARKGKRTSSQASPQDALPVPITGLVGEGAASRSGEDTRKRGWFWHWNSIITQYAPLIGLKGVGLLNSYTVWTDRREESPHRGYAFPSQQSEADFYGEDRAELIAINKILVALDLIEIRKEMVLRTDPQGRRWRVPHNFYRVKDHDDGNNLTARDVLEIVAMADRDRTIYRLVRHIFSPRFSPIDPNNAWVAILAEVRVDPLWQRLSAKAEREDARASARTKAGHAARKGAFLLPANGDSAATSTTPNDSDAVASPAVDATSVAPSNIGSGVAVEPANNGSDPFPPTSVAPDNSDAPTTVAPTNTTYHQAITTTTTGRSKAKNRPDPGIDRAADATPAPAEPTLTRQQSGGPAGTPPADAPAEIAALRAFEEANGRPSTPAERRLLRGLAERFEPAALEQRIIDLPSGWSWVSAAVWEAVDAGSAFVAPKRLREILGRWEREGHPLSAIVGAPDRGALPLRLGDGPDLTLPHGHGARQTWSYVAGLLGQVLARDRLEELLDGTAIGGYADGEVVILAPTRLQADRLSGEYRDLVARKLGEAMRRPVRVAVQVPLDDPAPDDHPAGSAPALPLPFVVHECGLGSGQVWSAIQEEAVLGGELPRAEVDAWLRSTQLLGRGTAGSLVVGVPNETARRRVSDRIAPRLGRAVAAVTGRRLPLEVVVTDGWLASGGEREETA